MLDHQVVSGWPVQFVKLEYLDAVFELRFSHKIPCLCKSYYVAVTADDFEFRR